MRKSPGSQQNLSTFQGGVPCDKSARRLAHVRLSGSCRAQQGNLLGGERQPSLTCAQRRIIFAVWTQTRTLGYAEFMSFSVHTAPPSRHKLFCFSRQLSFRSETQSSEKPSAAFHSLYVSASCMCLPPTVNKCKKLLRIKSTSKTSYMIIV